MKITNDISQLPNDSFLTRSVKPVNSWKPTAYFILGIIMLVIFAAVIGYMVYCAIEA